MKFEEFFHDIVITMYENIRDLEEKKGFADTEEKDYSRQNIQLWRSAGNYERFRQAFWF